ncbi:MAG: ADP-ribosylglycohydrolase family protein [Polyangiaceae bacterium]
MEATPRLLRALDGLSVGDGFGECFFGFAHEVVPKILERELPEGPWRWTDDTEMAVGLAQVLLKHGEVVQADLATTFASNMDPTRGYGRGAYDILTAIAEGRSWSSASRQAFRGSGSFGNGAAMRVAPLGAFLADRPLPEVVEQARLSAEVTHAHAEGMAGAIAVAVATVLAMDAGAGPLGNAWLREVRDLVPEGYTRDTIDEALSMEGASVVEAARALGNGTGVSAPDTVPFCLWICAHHGEDFVHAMWQTVSALGDRDTTCAIVGGILAGRCEVPEAWLARREPLPTLRLPQPT